MNLGTAALRAFLERYPKHANASRAHLEIAQSYLNRGRPADATAGLKQFLADPRCRDCKELPEAQNLLGRAYQMQKDFPQALAAWREFLAKYPAHCAWSTVQQAIVETEYLMALDQFAAKKYAEANKLFAEFLTKYPLDGRNPAILLLMNQQNVAKEKWDEAISAWRRLVSKYPGTDRPRGPSSSIAATLEQKLGKLEEALEEYRKVTWGSAAGRAQQAAARLTAKTMTVATERVFRSDETPKLKLVTRNIESVTVRVYKVDLETYFRKMHLARGVEGLDISLIDPDATFEFKVPKYVKHQEIESEIPVGWDKLRRLLRSGSGDAGTPTTVGGVMAVTVSSKALEATTMVVQSDLDVIVKSSREEVFVFAENMLAGKPWPGVRLLVSDGRQVLCEGTTDAQGIFRKTYKDLPTTANFSPAETAPAANPPPGGTAPAQEPLLPPAPAAPPAPTAPAPSASDVPATGDLSLAPGGQAVLPPSGYVPPGAATGTVPAIQPPAAEDPFGASDLPAAVAGPNEREPQLPARPQAAVERRGMPLNVNDIRVFAVSADNVASNMLNLQGVGVARGLTDKGYIYTDRPAYRAGQLVNIRGCLRRAADDAYVSTRTSRTRSRSSTPAIGPSARRR